MRTQINTVGGKLGDEEEDWTPVVICEVRKRKRWHIMPIYVCVGMRVTHRCLYVSV